MEVSPWFRRYDDNEDEEEDFLDDFEEEYNYCEDRYDAEEEGEPSSPFKAAKSTHSDKENEQAEGSKADPQKRVTFQQDYHPPKQPHQPIVDLNSRRMERHNSKSASLKVPHTVPQVNFDANDASIPSESQIQSVPLTRPVILHGRLVERAQPDYSNAATPPFSMERTVDSTVIALSGSNTKVHTDPPIRDTMERRSVFYLLTSDTARLRSFVNALDDVIRQTTQFQKTRSPTSCSVSSISHSSASHYSTSQVELGPQTQSFRLAAVPRLLSTVPEGEDQAFFDNVLPGTTVDAHPEIFQHFHHRNPKHINIAAWRVTNLVAQATALDSKIWKNLYDYEQKLQGSTLQQRHLQSACLRLHKDYRRVNRALKLCLSRLSKNGSITVPDDYSISDVSSAGTTPTTRSVLSLSKSPWDTAKAEDVCSKAEEPKNGSVPVSKVGWIDPKPEVTGTTPPMSREGPTPKAPERKPRASAVKPPMVADPPAPSMIEARTRSRKSMQDEAEEKVDTASKDASFYISFIPTELDSMVPSWKEDDTLTMYTLYEQHQEGWKKHIPWFLACCGPSATSERRDDFDDDTYRFDIEDGEMDDGVGQEEARDLPQKWNRRYYPRQRRDLSLPREPREAVF